MDKTGGFGSMIGGGVSKVLGGVKGAVKNYGPMAALSAIPGVYGLYSQYQADTAAEAQHKANPPRRALASIPGASNIVDMRRDLMPKLGGDKAMASSLVTVLDQYLERERAFEWGVEQFCKQAGFDADDTKAMMELVKVARLPGGLSRVRSAGRGGLSANLKLQPVVKSQYAPPELLAPKFVRPSVADTSRRMRDFAHRRRLRETYTGGSRGYTGGGRGVSGGAAAAGAGGADDQTQTQAAGESRPDHSWLPWAGLLGGGYLAHGYGTEGGTYSMFDPPEVRAQKQKNRNAALGIKDPNAPVAAAPAATGATSFTGDVAARNRSIMESYLKQLEIEGPDDPVTAARQLYGGIGQPSSMNNLNYVLGQQPEFRPRLEKTFGNEWSQKILNKLRPPAEQQGA